MTPLAAHSVAIQAPYHGSFTDPLHKGFASVHNVYQMFAGSMRIMEAAAEPVSGRGRRVYGRQAVSVGAALPACFTKACWARRGPSCQCSLRLIWRRSCGTPQNCAADHWPCRARHSTTCSISPLSSSALIPERVFAVMGDNDVFFRFDKHAPIFAQRVTGHSAQHACRGHVAPERLLARSTCATRWTGPPIIPCKPATPVRQ